MRRVLTAALACAAAVLTACGTPQPPEVTFYADGKTVRVTPQILCEVGTQECLQNEDAVASLRIRPGKPVQVSVPADIAQSPWGVAFSYLDREGQRVDASSRVFFPKDNQYAYTLELPDNADRLLIAAVQKLAVINGNQLLVSGYWILQARP
ncbi:DUF2771 family protein [Actinokineospora iranica]|uniref:DUF2771 domain-containing protein n=1 Tax=Actinokineospora iranica TaxID=1271860 RepID=A0A1G6THG8_9PSEU|nr:DUF2771 family protein [Actinokineospora iranica]SDD27956.1 Protein of unknown function [Actinokineospora iranica]